MKTATKLTLKYALGVAMLCIGSFVTIDSAYDMGKCDIASAIKFYKKKGEMDLIMKGKDGKFRSAIDDLEYEEHEEETEE